MARDGIGNEFHEVPLSNGEQVRVTYIEQGWAGQGGLRIQIRETNGRLRQGPEIPVDQVGDVVSAVINLLRSGT
ncbi:MAG: hypothetical protein ABSH09_32875, partial [Bryobacteraceae bacterium]